MSATANPSVEFEALLFDVFGTVTDWKSSMLARGSQLGHERGLVADWEALMLEWRSRYPHAIAPIREGRRPWVDFDSLHREELDRLLPRYGLESLTEADRAFLVHGWHRTEPWEDAVPAINRLKARYIVAPLSNGSVRQLVDIAKHGKLNWDLALGADIFRKYKPSPELYREALALIGSPASRVVMVAAHNYDLQGAKQAGMRTAFLYRATEDKEPDGDYDYTARDLGDLAQQLGA